MNAHKHTEKRPNIILILTDQQRSDTIHELGNPIIQTPYMDRLCREGTAFEAAYTPSPVCVPGRCCLYFGLYPFHSGCYDNGFPMPGDKPTMMRLLTDAGYRTHGIGKVHFTPKRDGLYGFQTRERQEEGGAQEDDYLDYLLDKGYDHIFDAHGQRSEMYYIPQISQLPAEDHPTQWVGDRALEFIGRQEADQPYYLMVSFIHPHPPFAPPTPWNKLYRAKEMPFAHVPEGYEDCLTYINHHQNRYKYRDQGIDSNLVRTQKAFYYACISFIDYQIGRILEALEAKGELDNTLIMLTSDHGEMLGDYNSFGKRSMLNPAVRVPMIARFPQRLQAGERCGRPTSLVDILPTALDAAGIDAPQGMNPDGESLFRVADGQTSRKYVFSQYQQGNRALFMIASDQYKYVYSAPDDKEYFYNHAIDPTESANLASDPGQQALMLEMKEQLLRLMRKEGRDEAVNEHGWVKYPTMTVPDDPNEGLLFQDAARFRERESALPPGYTASFPKS